jgi:AcrR family transcriptional regulator
MSATRADQRTRLLAALVEVVAEEGYLGAKIGDIAGRAGVSRATFYEMFASKEACFLEAHREHAATLLEHARRAVLTPDENGPLRAASGVLVAVAQEQPHEFAFLTHEALIAGPQPLAARERLLDEIAELIDHAAGTGTSVEESAPDLPARLLVGAVVRTLGISMRRGEHELGPLVDELVTWGALYDAARAGRRWRELKGEPALVRAASEAGYTPLTPRASPRGRHGLPAAVVRRNQRERILHATAAAISEKGYEHTTVADIVTAGGLSRDVFYGHFSSRRDALEHASRLFFEQAIAAMAGAFFTAPGSWPERVWRGGLALGEFMAAAPTFMRVACIDAYAPGPAAARRTDELLLAFTVFIEHGASEREPERVIPPLASTAVVATLAETVVALIASDRLLELPGFVALGVYLALAPYNGVTGANRFLERKLRELSQER